VSAVHKYLLELAVAQGLDDEPGPARCRPLARQLSIALDGEPVPGFPLPVGRNKAADCGVALALGTGPGIGLALGKEGATQRHIDVGNGKGAVAGRAGEGAADR